MLHQGQTDLRADKINSRATAVGGRDIDQPLFRLFIPIHTPQDAQVGNGEHGYLGIHHRFKDRNNLLVCNRLFDVFRLWFFVFGSSVRTTAKNHPV